MKNKRYEINYIRYSRKYFDSIEYEKVLFRTNSYFLAKLYFKNRITIFRDFVKNYDIEVLVYDYSKYSVVCRFRYFYNSKK